MSTEQPNRREAVEKPKCPWCNSDLRKKFDCINVFECGARVNTLPDGHKLQPLNCKNQEAIYLRTQLTALAAKLAVPLAEPKEN